MSESSLCVEWEWPLIVTASYPADRTWIFIQSWIAWEAHLPDHAFIITVNIWASTLHMWVHTHIVYTHHWNNRHNSYLIKHAEKHTERSLAWWEAWEAEAGGLWVGGQPRLQRETLFQNQQPNEQRDRIRGNVQSYEMVNARDFSLRHPVARAPASGLGNKMFMHTHVSSRGHVGLGWL